jgi:heat shock protein HslJ
MALRLALVAALLSGCAAVSRPPFDATEWLSTAVTEDGADRPLVDGTRIRLSFTDGQVAASAGCNTMGGAYRIEEGLLVVEGGGMTEMGCDEERHAQDDWLFGFLGSQPAVAQEGDKLTLTSDETVIALQDREVAEPDLPLIGTTWTVDTILSGDAASSVPRDQVATLVFQQNGAVEIATGCSPGEGTYEVANGSLRIRDMVTIETDCGDAARQLEAAVIPILAADEIDYVIDAGSLTLVAGDQGLIMRGE